MYLCSRARRRLNLSGNRLKDGGARMLATALWDNSALRKLELSDNGIGDQGVGAPRSGCGHSLLPRSSGRRCKMQACVV
jgi:hypothetical protein